MRKFVIVSTLFSIFVGFDLMAGSCVSYYSGKTNRIKSAISILKEKTTQKLITGDHEVLTADQVIKKSKKVSGIGGYTRVMKTLIDIRDHKNPVVHFIDTNEFEYHYDYAVKKLGYRGPLDEFNRKNYADSGDKRDFILASVITNVQEVGSPKSILELFSGDDLDAVTMVTIMNVVGTSLSGMSQFQFHPLSDQQEKTTATLLDQKQVLLTRDLAANLSYLAFNPGEAVGYIKFISKADYESGKVLLGPSDIAVFDQVPNDIGLVAGVITIDLQTALSHVNVKSINRGTLNAYLKDPAKLKSYANKPVRIVASEEGLQISDLDPAKADAEIFKFWKSRRKTLTTKPAAVIDPKLEGKILNLTNYYKKLPTKPEHQHLIQIVGAKAANLALLKYIVRAKNLPCKVPDTEGLPFNVYNDFWKTSQPGLDSKTPARVMTLEDRVVELLNSGDLLNPEKVHRIEVVVPLLTEVRRVMSGAKIPDNIIQDFKRQIMDDQSSPIHISKIPRFRLRSSTNSEDIEGFTGAGLYDSDGINLYKKLPNGGFDRTKPRKWEDIEADIRTKMATLFSAVFNERAFMERDWFGISGDLQLLIKGGLAIHNAFPLRGFDGNIEEHANGVAVTTDLYRTADGQNMDYPKITIVIQHFDLAVTNPPAPEDLVAVGEDPNKPYSTAEYVVTNFMADPVLNDKPDSWKQWPVELARQTTVQGGKDVISIDEARTLGFVLQEINKSMAKVFEQPNETFVIDSEFKFYGPDRTLTIKQARPFVRPPQH